MSPLHFRLEYIWFLAVSNSFLICHSLGGDALFFLKDLKEVEWRSSMHSHKANKEIH